MSLLTRTDLQARINSGKADQIYIDPLLSDDQIGSVSVDLRLGCDFLVSVLSHKPSVILHPIDSHSGPETFFQSARRDLGDAFLIHPLKQFSLLHLSTLASHKTRTRML